MNNIERLSNYIEIVESDNLDPKDYSEVIMTLTHNQEVECFTEYYDIIQESLGTEELPTVITSVNNYLKESFSIVEFRVKKRTVRQKTKRRDPKRSRIAKMSWRKNKARMKRGLQRFHKSSKGKAFHKSLGKFVSKRSKKKESVTDVTNLEELVLELHEVRITLSSAITQMYIDMKNNPENFDNITLEDQSILLEVYTNSMLELEEALSTQDPEVIDDAIDEVIAEVGSIFIGVDMDFIYFGEDLTEI